MSYAISYAVSADFYTAVFIKSNSIGDISFITHKRDGSLIVDDILRSTFILELIKKEFDTDVVIDDLNFSVVSLDCDLQFIFDKKITPKFVDTKKIDQFKWIPLVFDYDSIAKLGEFMPNELDAIFNIKRYKLDFPNDLKLKIDASQIAEGINKHGAEPVSCVYSNVIAAQEPTSEYLKLLSLNLEKIVRGPCLIGINFDPFFKYATLAAGLEAAGYSASEFFSLNSVKPEFIYMQANLENQSKVKIFKDDKEVSDKFLKSKVNFMSLKPENSLTIKTLDFEQTFDGLSGFSLKA